MLYLKYVNAKDIFAFFPPRHPLLVQEPALQFRIALSLEEVKFQPLASLSLHIHYGSYSWVEVWKLHLTVAATQTVSLMI